MLNISIDSGRARVAALACGWLASAAAFAADVLTPEQAVTRALERNPAVTAARDGVDVAEARLRRARAWDNPTLSVEAEDVLGRGEYAGFDAAQTTVSMSQPLPLGAGRRATIRGARADMELASVDAAIAERDVRRDVIIAYAEAVAAERLATLERERARLGAAAREAVERRYRAGLESELQRSRVEVETSGLQAAARRAQSEAQQRRRDLAAHWREADLDLALDQAWFDAAPVFGPRADPEAIRAAPGAAGHPPEHSHVARARLAQARAEAALAAARGARYGGIEAVVGNRQFSSGPADSDQAWVLGLSMPLPLWDRNGAGIAEARAALAASEIQVEEAARELVSEREAARADYEAAALEVEALAGSGLPAATLAAQLAAQGYDGGRLSLLERLDAERALSDLAERLVRARLELRRAEARLDNLH